MNYRDIIYNSYLSNKGLANASAINFKSNAPMCNQVIKKFFPADKSSNIVDLGCGSGALIYFAKLAGYSNIQGVDCSPEQVAAGKVNGLTNLTHSDIQEFLIQLPENSQDVIITFDVIEHLAKDELLALSKAISNALKKSGRWIIHTVNGESPFFGRIRYGDLTHEQAVTNQSLRQILNIGGFTKTTFYEDTPIPHNVKSFIRRQLWRLIRSFWRFCLMVETGESSGLFTQNFFALAEK